MDDTSIPRHVPQFTKEERYHLKGFATRLIFRRQLSKRAKIWVSYIGIMGTAALAVVHWGTDLLKAVWDLLHAFGPH